MCVVLDVSFVLFALPFMIGFGIIIHAKGKEEECYCGTAEDDDDDSHAQYRIMNGENVTNIYKYPFVVSIFSPDSDKKLCSAAIISPTAVLTAAHCNKDGDEEMKDASQVEVGLIGEDGNPRQKFKVKEIFNHPKYKKGSHDISILLLEDEIKCEPGSIPICIPEKDMGKEGLKVKIVGTGLSQKSGEQEAEELVTEGKAKQIMKNCEKSKFCIQGMDSTTPCFGDSGGVIFLKKKKVFYSLGVTSTVGSKKCKEGETSEPVNTTNTYYYRSFIEKHVKDLPSPKEE